MRDGKSEMKVGVLHVLVLACGIFKLEFSLGGQMGRLSVTEGIGLQRVQGAD